MNTRRPSEPLQSLLAAMLEGQLTAQEMAELRGLLRGDAAARRQYVRQVMAHAMLQWINAPPGIIGTEPDAGCTDMEAPAGLPELEEPRPGTAVPVEAARPWFATIPMPQVPFSVLMAYSLATLLAAAMVVGFYRLPHADLAPSKDLAIRYEPVLSPAGANPHEESDAKWIGRVTAAPDCRWQCSPAPNRDAASARLGSTYTVASGLLEIAYRSGAKVFLQGPCSYKIESLAGGFLSAGKLTAVVNEKAEDENRTVQDRNGSSSVPLRPSPFVIRTPVAAITGEDGEFAVEVQSQRVSQTYVFRGMLVLRFVGDVGMEPEERRLGANDYARVEELGRSVAATVMQDVACPSSFARSMARQPRLEDNIKGHSPANLVDNDRRLGFQPAHTVPAEPQNLARDGAESQWSIKYVALGAGARQAANGATHTARVSFELTENVDLDSVELVGQYVTENRVKAMRFNGKVLRRGPSRTPEVVGTHSGNFHLLGDFVRGTNLLEIDIQQLNSTGSPEDKLLSLRMEMHADRKANPPSAPASGARERHNSGDRPAPPAKGGSDHDLM